MMGWRTAFLHEFVVNLRGFDWAELRYVSACGYWPFAVYVVICVGGAVLFLLLSSLALLPGLNASWQIAQEQSAALELESAALRQQIDTSSARAVSMLHQCAHCPALHRRLRPADPMPVVLDQLRNAAAAHGIAITALRPEKSWQQLSVKAFEIDIQLRADKRQMTAFLGDIAAMRFALTVKQADFQVASTQGRLTLFLLVDDNGMAHERNVVEAADHEGVNVGIIPVTGADQRSAGDTQWQRVAFIQRGNRYLEVLRDSRGKTRRRAGELVEVAP